MIIYSYLFGLISIMQSLYKYRKKSTLCLAIALNIREENSSKA